MNSSAWRKAARSAARSAAEGALGFCVCAALARLLCPRAEFAPAAAGLALAWAAAAAGTAALALGNAASFGAALAAFWGGIGLRALLFVFLAALCFAQAGAVPALLAYAGGTAAALLALESRWLLRTR